MTTTIETGVGGTPSAPEPSDCATTGQEPVKTARRRPAPGPKRSRPRLRGDERQDTVVALAASYAAGASIRALAEERDMSYGLVRTLLLDHGVALRSRGRGPNQISPTGRQ
ncbi:helix-turn-helix domain-containing protein [Streptomyces sp. Iso 434]|uniref:helix-turn-helix domain-containing protein n=1 Tax=Streptomyces sp. Iso 434 TaxID=3062272 RepID=UPI003980436D